MYTPKFKEKKKFNFMGLAVVLATLLFAAFLGLMLRESADPDTTLGTEATPSASTQTTQTAPSSEAPSTAPSTQPSTAPSTEPSETIHTHSYTAAEVIAATCTEDGYTLMACACGVTYHAHQVSATGHEHVKTETVKPTCTEKGYTVYACHCGDSYKTEEKKPPGTNMKFWKRWRQPAQATAILHICAPTATTPTTATKKPPRGTATPER